MANNLENTTGKISTSERTNEKNLENLHIANTIIESVGTAFKPTNPLILKDALLEFENSFITMTDAVRTASIAEENAVDAQIAAFKPVSKRVTKIMKAVRAQNLEDLFVEGLQSDSYRLNGVRINKNTPDTTPNPENGASSPPAPNTSSVSRRSYAGIIESLRIISGKLSSNPAYNPNETEYRSPEIAAWVDGLQTTHNTALDAKVHTRTTRNTRNAHAYNEETGIIKRMNALKNYLGYILDKDDPRLKQLKSLKFTDNTK